MKYIGITGARRAGKDTFASLLKQVTSKQVINYAFANALKGDLSDLFRDKFNADIHTLDGDIKEKLRPIMIAYGCAWREIDPLHWVKEVTNAIDTFNKSDKDNNLIHCICDVRFKNEAEYLKSKYGNQFFLINIVRIGGPEPTEEEKKHIPELEKMLNYTLTWETTPDLVALQPIVEEIYKKHLS